MAVRAGDPSTTEVEPQATTEHISSVTPIILLLLAAMWAAVLLPSYLRGKGVGSGSGGAGSAFSAAKERMESFHLGGSGYLPVGGDLGPQQQQTPLPHGARYPVGSGPKAMKSSESYRPTKGSVQVLGETTNAISILGPAVDPDPTGPRATVTELRPRREQRALQALATQAEAVAPEHDGSFVDEFGVRHDAPVGGRASAPRVSPAAAPAGAPRPVSAGLSKRRAARQRRRQVFYSLLGATGATFLLTFLVGGPMGMLFLLSLVALGGYVVLLLQVQKSEAERDIKVAFLPHGGQGAAPTTLLREAGGGLREAGGGF